MPITNINDVVVKTSPQYEFLKTGVTMAGGGRWHSFFYTGPRPAAASANGSALAGATCVSPITGQIPLIEPSGAGIKNYVTKLSASMTNGGTLIILDRLWHNDSIAEATTTAQTVNSITWPPRDSVNTTNGSGIMIGLEVSTATTNAAVINTTTISYTNDMGTSGRTGQLSLFPANAQAGTFIPFELQSGDTGVQSIQSVTLGTSYVTGNIHLVAYRHVAQVFVPANTNRIVADALSTFQPLASGACPFFVIIPITAASQTLNGSIAFAQG